MECQRIGWNTVEELRGTFLNSEELGEMVSKELAADHQQLVPVQTPSLHLWW